MKVFEVWFKVPAGAVTFVEINASVSDIVSYVGEAAANSKALVWKRANKNANVVIWPENIAFINELPDIDAARLKDTMDEQELQKAGSKIATFRGR